MKYKIILCEGEETKINWQLMHDYSLVVNIPISFLSNQDENLELNSDLVRREGAAIHAFLIGLNRAVGKSKDLKRVSVNYSDKCQHQNIEILDNFLEGFSLANYQFNRHKTTTNSLPFKLETKFKNKMVGASVKGACIARDLVNEPLSHLNAEKLSSTLERLAK